MRRFKEIIAHFMYGRHGFDQLNIALLILYLVLLIVRSFFRNNSALLVISLLIFLVFVLIVFRCFSKNAVKRCSENEKFLLIYSKLKSFCTKKIRRLKSLKQYVYRTCPECKAKLRLPRKTGSHWVNCPKCGKKFSVYVLFGKR